MKSPESRNQFGWVMYDWANSAYITTVAVAVLPIYFADAVIGPKGFAVFGVTLSATTLWAWMIGLSALIIFLSAPFLGAIADFSSSKKRFLFAFCYTGSIATLLFAFCGPGDVWLTMGLFVLAQTAFVGGNVFYDAFLPHIASDDKLDWISGKGFAYGYIGGGLQFLGALLVITFHEALGLSAEFAARAAMVTAGLWWGGFAIVTFVFLDESQPKQHIPARFRGMNPVVAYLRIGISRTLSTAVQVGRFKHLLLFLIAFMIYNDGIQTVITMATIYGREELEFAPRDLMLTLLIIQFVAFFGALLFGRIGERISAKRALMITLAMWSFVVIYAYFMTSAREYYILGVIVGLSLGGSQSLSRSLYGSIVPREASAEFYGFYSVFSKFSAIWGPLIFGIIDTLTGSTRQAIISLIIFFIVGMLLLVFVNVESAKATRNEGLFGG